MRDLIGSTFCVLLGTTLLGGAAQGADTTDHARYRVTFERTWSNATHPADFPLLAHFSPVIGITTARDTISSGMEGPPPTDWRSSAKRASTNRWTRRSAARSRAVAWAH